MTEIQLSIAQDVANTYIALEHWTLFRNTVGGLMTPSEAGCYKRALEAHEFALKAARAFR